MSSNPPDQKPGCGGIIIGALILGILFFILSKVGDKQFFY